MKRIYFRKANGEIDDTDALHRWLDKAVKYITNGEYMLTLTRIARNRSLNQNRLMWMWFTCLQMESGQPKEDWHDHFCLLFLGRDFVTADGEVERLAGHTSTLNTAQMTDFLNKVQSEALTEWGVRLPLPEEIGYEEFRLQYERFV